VGLAVVEPDVGLAVVGVVFVGLDMGLDIGLAVVGVAIVGWMWELQLWDL